MPAAVVALGSASGVSHGFGIHVDVTVAIRASVTAVGSSVPASASAYVGSVCYYRMVRSLRVGVVTETAATGSRYSSVE